MNIEYTYKIINVDKTNRSMEIVYDSPKYGTLHVGARLPWKNESVEDIVSMYNPSAYWLEQDMETAEVKEGTSGSQQVELLFEHAEQDASQTDSDGFKPSLCKYQAFFALAAMGLLDKADTAVKNKGSFKLLNGWEDHSNLVNGSWAVRNCKETVELQKLLGVSPETMDQVFTLGAKIDWTSPKKSLSGDQIEVFNVEVRIWELKEKLKQTDYKALPDYDGDGASYLKERQLWREEIRSLRQSLN